MPFDILLPLLPIYLHLPHALVDAKLLLYSYGSLRLFNPPSLFGRVMPFYIDDFLPKLAILFFDLEINFLGPDLLSPFLLVDRPLAPMLSP